MEQNNEVNPQELRNMEVLQQQDPGEHGQQEVGDVQQPPRPPPTPCPRCDSPETKFCYFNNHKADQPRFYCKTCRRYWTRGGTLRNIPIGGTSRKLKKSSKRASPCVNPVTMPCSAEDTIVSSPESPLKTEELGNMSTSPVPVIAHGGATQIPRFSSRSSAHDTQKRHRLNNIMSSDFTISGGSINLPPSRLKQYHQLQWYQQQQQLAHISVSGSLSSVREIQKLNHFANLRGSDFIHSGILNFPPSGLQHHHQVQRHQRAQPLQQQEHFSGSGLLSSVAEIQKPTHLSDMINSDFILSSGLNPPPSNMQDQLQQPQHQKQSQQHPAPSHNPSCGLLSSVPEIQHLKQS